MIVAAVAATVSDRQDIPSPSKTSEFDVMSDDFSGWPGLTGHHSFLIVCQFIVLYLEG
jgi:hypothetical protein